MQRCSRRFFCTPFFQMLMRPLKHPLATAALSALAVIAGGSTLVFAAFTYFRQTAALPAAALPAPAVVVENKSALRIEPLGKVDPSFKFNVQELAAAAFAGQAAHAVLPDFSEAVGPIFEVNATGTIPARVALSLPLPPATADPELLEMHVWDGSTWRFVSAMRSARELQAEVAGVPRAVAIMRWLPAPPLAGGMLEIGETFAAAGEALQLVFPAGLVLQKDGSLAGTLAGVSAPAGAQLILPVVRAPVADGSTTVAAALTSPAARTLHLSSLADLAAHSAHSGVLLDYGVLMPAMRADWTAFIRDLAARLHAQQKQLGVVVPATAGADPNANGYDLRSIGATADWIELHFEGGLLAADEAAVRQTINAAASASGRRRLRLQINFGSVELEAAGVRAVPAAEVQQWLSANLQPATSSVVAIATPASFALGNPLAADAHWGALSVDYKAADGSARTLLQTTPAALARQLQLAQQLRLGGVSVTDYFAAPAGGLAATLAQYRGTQDMPATGATIAWQVQRGADLITESTKAINEPFEWTPTEAGDYTVRAMLNLGTPLALGALPVTVPARPEPTEVAQAMPGMAARPIGPFELGGQVTHGGIAPAEKMRASRMTWVKLQALPGYDMGAAIANAHALGFKALLSAVGDRSQPHLPAYHATFAAYLGTLAAQGADAIEVWNEPNLEREWPAGKISTRSYTALLRAAYKAIKAANPNTLVISAAPSPTGYFGGCSSRGCDDANWMNGIANAGAGNYLDCVGIHYNEGVVPPSAYGGGVDPRDDHYTRYFPGMIERYSAAFGGNRQLCFTELGYLSGEEWGYVPKHYLWKPPINNTVAEQAAYLGEAVRLARSKGRVRMIMVFNVDFANYGDDPMAGYAIIRPDGSCPACVTLAASMQ